MIVPPVLDAWSVSASTRLAFSLLTYFDMVCLGVLLLDTSSHLRMMLHTTYQTLPCWTLLVLLDIRVIDQLNCYLWAFWSCFGLMTSFEPCAHLVPQCDVSWEALATLAALQATSFNVVYVLFMRCLGHHPQPWTPKEVFMVQTQHQVGRLCLLTVLGPGTPHSQ